VVNPGVYELPAGSRVFDALELAGGITEEGVPTALNFAEQIYDGEQILVPTWEEYEAGWTVSGTEAEEDGLININTATKEQLMTLNGIGESRAQAIIAYREEHGPFTAIEDLMLVSGIKEAAFEKVKDYITVQ
jgi:competence protein ComEA